ASLLKTSTFAAEKHSLKGSGQDKYLKETVPDLPEAGKDEETKDEKAEEKEDSSEKDSEADSESRLTESENNQHQSTKNESDSKPEADHVLIHNIKENETLFDITMQYYPNGGYQEQVAEFNGITNPERDIQVGMKLSIPDPQFG